MVGAAIPDCNRLDLVVPAEAITAATGIPWAWGVTHRAGTGLLIALLVTLLVTLLVRPDLPRAVFAMCCVGIASHFVIDYFLWQSTGHTNLMLWPVLDLTVEYQGFYRSSDRWPAVVATVLAGIVLVVDRRRG